MNTNLYQYIHCLIGIGITILAILIFLGYLFRDKPNESDKDADNSVPPSSPSLPKPEPPAPPSKPEPPVPYSSSISYYTPPKPEPTYFDLGPQCRKTKYISYSQPLYISKPLMTANERGWYDALVSYFKYKGYYAFPQICLRSIIDKTYNTDRFMELFHMVDFVITNSNMQVLYAVEINDRSHQLPDRKERDEKVAAILETAKIPLITFASMESLANIPTKFDNKKALL